MDVVQNSTCTLEVFPTRMFHKSKMFIGLFNLKRCFHFKNF